MGKSDYLVVKGLLESGAITTISDLVALVDKTPFSREAKTTPERLDRMLRDLALFRFGDCYNMAQIIGVDERLLIDLVHNEYVKRQKGKK